MYGNKSEKFKKVERSPLVWSNSKRYPFFFFHLACQIAVCLQHAWEAVPAVKLLIKALPQSQRGPPSSRDLCSPAASKTWVHPAGTLPSSCWRGTAGGGIIPHGWWDGTHVPLSSHPSLSPLLLSDRERDAGPPCLVPSICSKSTWISHYFLPALECPTRVQSPIFRLHKLNCRLLAVQTQLLAGGRGSLTLTFLGFPQHPWLLLCFCGLGCSSLDLARHWMCLVLLLEVLATVY